MQTHAHLEDSDQPEYNFMPEDMDLDTGTILEGSESLDQCGQRIFDALLRWPQASRQREARIGDEEFAPWIKAPYFLIYPMEQPLAIMP